MAKKKLETEFPMFESDLDFNFDDEIGEGINQEAKPSKKRTVVTNVLAGAKEGVKDTLQDPGFIKQTLRKILPDTYGEIATGTQEIATGIHTLYDQPIRELKPRINSIMKKVDTLVPEGQKTLKSLSDKVLNWSGGKDTANSSTAESQDEQAVTSMLGAIFQQNKAYSDIAQRKEVMKDISEKKRFTTSTNILDDIRQNTSIMSQYTTNVTQAYQRKMLELTLRSYLVQRDNLVSFKDYVRINKLQNEAIIKNTALPEFLKITKTEAFLEAGRRNVINALYGDGSKLQKAVTKLKGSAMEMVSGAASALDNIDMTIDQAMSAREAIAMQNEMNVSMGLPPLTKAEMAGAMAAGNAVEWIRDKIAKPLKDKLGKNKKLTEGLGKVSRHMMNPAGLVNKIRSGDSWSEKTMADGPKGSAYRFMDFIMEHFTDDGPGKTFENKFDTNKLKSPAMGFDNKAHLSLTEVIPGHLAAIHREIRILRTNDESTPISTYDFQRREFVTDKTMGARIIAGMKYEAQNSKSRRSIDEAADSFKGNIKLNDEEEIELKLFFSRIARIGNMEITPENIRNTSAFEKLSLNVKTLVNKKLEEMDTSDDREVQLSGLTKKVTNIRAGFPSMEESIGNNISSGYGDILAKQKVAFKDYDGKMQERGIIRRTEEGNFVRDEEAFNAFLEQNGITRPDSTTASSDINVKEAIKEMKPKDLLDSVSKRFTKSITDLKKKGTDLKDRAKNWNPKEAYEGVKKTKLFNWFYKDGKGDADQHSGPMAQEVNKNLGEEAAPTGKKIDLVSLNGANMAAVKHLGDKVEEMKNDGKDRSIKELLSLIQKDTSEIVKQMNESGLHLKMPNFNGIDTSKLKSEAKEGFATARASFSKGIKHSLAGLEKVLTGGKPKSAMMTGVVDNLTAEDILNIRAMQTAFTLDGWVKKAADMFFKQFPQYKDIDTSDAVVEKARSNPNSGLHKSPEERSSMELLSSVAFEISKKVGNLGASLFGIGKSTLSTVNQKIIQPLWTNAAPLFKKALSKIDEAVGSAKDLGRRLSADDLMTIKEMKELLKQGGEKAQDVAASFFKRFPYYLEIDTSDEAIEKAKQDPSLGQQKTNEERGILAMAAGIVGKVGSRVFNFGKNIVNDIIPTSIKSLKSFASKAFNELGKKINPNRDLYIPGQEHPVILAGKLSKGDYRDSVNNKPLFTINDVIASKGDIINEEGNVVVTADELQNGLVDRTGQLVKSNSMTAVAGLVGAGLAIKDRFVKNLKYLKDTGSKVFAKIKDKITGKLPGQADSESDEFGSSSKYLKEGYQVWVDIRSIMLGQGDEVKKRLGIKNKFGFGSGDSESSSSSESVADDSTDNSVQATSTGKAPGIFDGIGQAASRVLGPKDESGNYVRGNSIRDRLSGWKTKAAESKFGQKVGGQMTRLKNSGFGNKIGQMANSRIGRIAGKGLSAAKFVGKGIIGGALSLGSMLLGGSSGNATEPGQEAEKNAANDPEKAKALAEHARPGEKVVKTKIAANKRAADDKDGDGVKDGSVEDRKAHLEELKASRQKEGAQADLTARYTTGGLMGDIAGKLSGIFSMITDGLSGMFSFGKGILSKIPGLGKIGQVAGKVLRPVGSFASRMGSKLLGRQALATGGRLLGRQALMTGARAVGSTALRLGAVALLDVLPAVAAGAAGVIGSALAAIGSVLASPVVIGAAAVAVTAYGGYKLYKYMTRNNANEYDRIRLRQYGVGDNTAFEEFNNRFLGLESYLLDGKIGYNNGKAYTIDRSIKAEEIAEIFKVDKEDKEHGEAVAKWYSERFKPFFLTHLTALQSANPKGKLDNISSLKPNEKVKYLEGVSFDSGPYKVNSSPIKSIPDLSTDSKPVLEAIRVLIENAGKEAQKNSKSIQLPTKVKDGEKPKTAAAEADYNEKLRKQKKAEEERLASIKSSDAREAKMLPQSAKEKATGQGEGDGPKPDVPVQLNKPDQSVTLSAKPVPMAPGAPTDGSDGDKFLKLGKGVDINGMNPETNHMLKAMAQEYGTLTGKSIQVNSGYRSYEDQAALYRQFPDRAAKPGRSLHEFGLAVDINSADAEALEKLGLMKKYGFTRPVGGEPWHMEPAGIQKNIELAKTNPTSRSEMVLASFRRGGGGAGTDPSATKHGRNQALAESLLNNSGIPVKDQIAAQSKDAPLNGVAIPNANAASVTGGLQGQPAANDSSTKQPVSTSQVKTDTQDSTKGTQDSNIIKANFRPSQENSTSKNLPTPVSNTTSNDNGEVNNSSASTAGDKNGDIKEAIARNAKKAGGDPNLMLSFAAVESSMNPTAKASGSSAAGLFQFTKSTWDEQLGKHGSKYGLNPNASPFDVDASSLLATEYVKSNLNAIKSVKPNPTVTDAYLTHFLGAGGAKKFLSQDPGTTAADVLPNAAAANPSIFGRGSDEKSIQEVYNNLNTKLSEKARSFGVSSSTSPMSQSTTKSSDTGEPILKEGGEGATGGTSSATPTTTSPGVAPASSTTPDANGSIGVQAAKDKREMISPSTTSGVFVDKRGSSMVARERREVGESFSGPNMVNIETSLNQSLGIQKDQLEVLRGILDNVSPEKLGKILADAVAASAKPASNQETMKEKDDKNMGRKDMAPRSSIDFSRKVM